MNSFADVLSKAGISSTSFNNDEVDEKQIELDLEIEFLETWIKMLERGASDKEKHNFVVKHGYVTVRHLSLYLSCKDDVNHLN